MTSSTFPFSWFRRLWPPVVFQFCFVATTALWKSAANAAVLSRVDAQVLPLLYIAGALLTAVVTGVVATQRLRVGPVSLGISGPLVVCVLSALLYGKLSFASLLLYVFAETFATFLSISFWATVGETFDAREAKRAFTQISGLGMLGSVVGGWAAQVLAIRQGILALLALGVALLLVGTWAYTFRVVGDNPSRNRSAQEEAQLWAYVKSHPYAQILALLVLLLAMLTAFSDYLFRVRAAQFLKEDELAALFGGFQWVMGLVCAVWQVFLAERLLQKVGVIRYIAAVPLLMVPWALASVAVSELWPAYGLKLLESVASLSVLPVGMQLLYGPVADHFRDKLRNALDGLTKKMGVALGGVLLLAGGWFFQGQALAVAVLLLCVCASMAVLGVRPLYVRTLRERVLNIPFDSAFEKIPEMPLKQALQSHSPSRILRALAWMEQSQTPVGPHLPRLLSHPDVQVQERALHLSMKEPQVDCVPLIEHWVTSGTGAVQKAAIWALAFHAPQRAELVLSSLVDAREPDVRDTAVGAILAHLPPSPVWSKAQDVLQAHVESSTTISPEKRRQSAHLLGRARNERWTKFLERYLHDEDATVRSAAIVAVGEGGYLSLAPFLLPRLSGREDRRKAREALTLLGDPVVAILESAMNDRSLAASIRYEIPRVLRQIGTQSALEALLFSNVQDDAFLHYRIGVALSRLFEAHPELKVDVKWVLEALGRRKSHYQQLLRPFLDIQAALGPSSLLSRAIGDRLDQSFELSFWLLGLLHDSVALRRVHAHLIGPDRHRQAWALEFLEYQLPHDEWVLIAEQVESHHRFLKVGDPSRLPAHVRSLSVADDVVLRACARQVNQQLGHEDLTVLEGDMREDIVRRMFALEGVEIFAHCDVDDLAAVAAVAREQNFKEGERIYSEGDPGDSLYVILQGTVDALRSGQYVLTLRDKQAFGDVSLLDGSPRPTDMMAAADTSVLIIDRRDFLDLVSDRPELLKGIYRAVAQQLRQMLDLPGRQTPKAS